MEEILDIVDQNDEVIGFDTRSNIKKKWLLHRFVHCIVINAQWEFVIQQRKSTKDSSPNQIDCSVWWHVWSGESYIQACTRECKEELWIWWDFQQIGTIHGHHKIGKLFILYHNGPYYYDQTEAECIDILTPQELKYLYNRFPYLLAWGFVSSINLMIQHWIIM